MFLEKNNKTIKIKHTIPILHVLINTLYMCIIYHNIINFIYALIYNENSKIKSGLQIKMNCFLFLKNQI